MIAKEACISKRAIYEFFETKKDIYAAVIAMNSSLLIDLPRPENEDLSLYESLIKIFKLDFDLEFANERESYIRMLNRDLANFPEISQALYDSGTINTRELLVDWLTSKREKNLIIGSKEDIDDYASMLMNIVFGSLLPKREHLNETKYRYEHIKKSIMIFISGLHHWKDSDELSR